MKVFLSIILLLLFCGNVYAADYREKISLVVKQVFGVDCGAKWENCALRPTEKGSDFKGFDVFKNVPNPSIIVSFDTTNDYFNSVLFSKVLRDKFGDKVLFALDYRVSKFVLFKGFVSKRALRISGIDPILLEDIKSGKAPEVYRKDIYFCTQNVRPGRFSELYKRGLFAKEYICSTSVLEKTFSTGEVALNPQEDLLEVYTLYKKVFEQIADWIEKEEEIKAKRTAAK